MVPARKTAKRRQSEARLTPLLYSGVKSSVSNRFNSK
jgi:hypothetical protein